MPKKNKLEFPHGVMMCYPHSDGHAVQLTFVGCFGRRKLRKMIKETTPLEKKTHIDFAIDNFCIKLKPNYDFKKQAQTLYEEHKDDA